MRGKNLFLTAEEVFSDYARKENVKRLAEEFMAYNSKEIISGYARQMIAINTSWKKQKELAYKYINTINYCFGRAGQKCRFCLQKVLVRRLIAAE